MADTQKPRADAALDRLASIDDTLKQILAFLRTTQAKAAPPIASDRDLDGQYGDPILKFIPRDWTGSQAFKGRRLSECPPELLDIVAEMYEFFATQSEAKGELTNSGKPLAGFKRADAARARGWAARQRSGRVKPATDAPPLAAPPMVGVDLLTGETAHGFGDNFGGQL